MRDSYLLGIFYQGQTACPDELPNESAEAYYATPKAAKIAGRAILARHADAVGFTVAKTFNGGHYRTAHTEFRAEVVAADMASTLTVEG